MSLSLSLPPSLSLVEAGAGDDGGAPGLWEGLAPTNSSPLSNTSSPPGGLLQGFCYLGVSVLGFGSSMVPVRSSDVGDGKAPWITDA